MRRLVIALIAALVVACSPPPPEGPTPANVPEAETPAEAMFLLDALHPALEQEIGAPISLHLTRAKVEGEWAFVQVEPRTLDGGELDWAQTALADRDEHGVLGDNGLSYALLRKDGPDWRVVTHVVGPTDAPWVTWAADYGAPASLFE